MRYEKGRKDASRQARKQMVSVRGRPRPKLKYEQEPALQQRAGPYSSRLGNRGRPSLHGSVQPPAGPVDVYSRRLRWWSCNLPQLLQLVRDFEQAGVDLPQRRLPDSWC